MSIEDISIHPALSKNKSKSSFDYTRISDYILSISYTQKWFHTLSIQNISYGDINASFLYKGERDGYITAHSPDVDLSASLNYNAGFVTVNIERLAAQAKDILVHGNIYIDTRKLKLYSKLDAHLTSEADLTLFASASINHLDYRIKSKKEITSIKKLIALASLGDAINLWAYDAITKMSYVELHDIYGFVDFNNLQNAYKNIYVKAIVHDVDYLYNPKLDAIHAQSVELEFLDGIFYIRPKEAYSYGMYLDKSWLKIDFTLPEATLTLQLLFDAQLNKDVLGILEAYKIQLPFLQHSGEVDTNLTLTIGLRNIDIDAQGVFYTDEANFDYLGLNIDIFKAKIVLNNFAVSIKNMQAKYKDIADANVTVAFDAAEKNGSVDFTFSKVDFGDIRLASKDKPLQAQYIIDKSRDFIEAQPSLWHFYDKEVEVDATNIPFDINETNVTIPTTYVKVKDFGAAFVSGVLNIKSVDTLLDIDVLRLEHSGLKFSQSNTPLKFSYIDKKMKLSADDTIHFSLSGTRYRAKDFLLEMQNNNILVKHTGIEIGKYITTKVYANYDINESKAHISLSDFTLKDPNSNALLYKNHKMLLAATIKDDIFVIDSPELNANFKLKESGWKLKLDSLDRIAKNSLFMKSFALNDGEFLLYKNNKDKFTRFKSKINYPYKLLIQNNKPVSQYTLRGKIYKEKADIDINNKLNITIKERVNVDLKKSCVNIQEVLRAIKEINVSNENNNSKALNVFISGKDSQLYVSNTRYILYDTLDAQYYNHIFTAQLTYKQGVAGMQLKDNSFHIYGQGFNDKFMNKLFSLSKFQGGSLDFSVSGNIKEYIGVIYISKTVIKEYKALNNILAFINTVPSLVTFSVPGYSKEGLKVKKAYMRFSAKDEKLNISDIYLNSKEIDILGKGSLDIAQSSIDLMLNLKTDLGSNLSKVPLVGYVLLGKDTISTTLSIKGKLENPKVKSLIATDIVVAPLNIIKRTLLLPYNILKKK